MKPFRWKNCFADVQASKHDMTIESYFQDVIVPALATLEAKIDELENSDWPGAVFAKADMEEVRLETMRAFGLSIQSIWERQLRSYLLGCSKDLRPGEPSATKIEKANWKELQKLFRGLRGIGLDAFPSFEVLDALQHLGNACRHGDGDSATELARRYPDFWPIIPPMPPGFGASLPSPPRVAQMRIPLQRLHEFVAAIARFWRDAEYIYNESIERKDPGLEARLVRERAERDWLPPAPAERN
ncbi:MULTISPECIES: hypothetical protein [unclassified Novosphingobium]|uniref:hypothetical protein n=1 Tax=unclassified Novosphingobium TaxID=2644732 RepID=UPI0014948B55|nr:MULTISPECIES: hypothetical protein [unclassified Novosphingobium]MBB3358812.1 hypothetical protein [Novosphingobium sp. BK256]MBB3375173.1 hypothetical protein [Novosphingobium sp. BK280]MBB3379139.1 hypothetical protein [Novosphingobium sp. BK258]MBB3420833.1 hypothetical protein [Novosphingobium sp. BK267]MBB3449594.1 hypothetical protein [Novosphingobium sp. BK352]